MRPLGKLAFGGGLLLLAGIWAGGAAALPSLGAGGAGGAALQVVALIVALASWRSANRDGHALAALGTSWAATIPGALLIAGVGVRSDLPGAGQLMLAVNLLWLAVAPYLFVTSALMSPLGSGLPALTLARFAHVGAWLSSSFVALSRWR
jgi:hypothetical protein